MLKDFEKSKPEDKEVVSTQIREMRDELFSYLQGLKEKKLPVLVLVEGWAAAGKGSLIKELISEIDPRFYNVITPPITPEREARYPFLYSYATAIPENGKIIFLDSGWVESLVRARLRLEITQEEYKRRIRQINEFERQLRDGGYLVLKLFLHIDREEQAERMERLCEKAETAWRVTDDDLWQQREYRHFLKCYDEVLEKTDEAVHWHILDGKKRKTAVRDALKLLTGKIKSALEKERYVGDPFKEEFPLVKMPLLSEVDLSPAIEEEEYKKELKKLQNRLSELHYEIYMRRIPVVIGYEGWDAAGKGGNIRRVAYPLDPRGFDVHPIASPEPHELNRHFLWRFWTRLPRSGHISIFDRTWYGRVMVERLEGFCSEKDWKRAYNEINEFERQLTEWGAVVLKFWIHIDKDTQLARFNDRQNTPEKQWKITDEDWRNREKWDLYEEAVNDMIRKTSTENAPWYIIESNDKKYARLRTLRIIIKALEDACSHAFERQLG